MYLVIFVSHLIFTTNSWIVLLSVEETVCEWEEGAAGGGSVGIC